MRPSRQRAESFFLRAEVLVAVGSAVRPLARLVSVSSRVVPLAEMRFFVSPRANSRWKSPALNASSDEAQTIFTVFGCVYARECQNMPLKGILDA